MASRLHHLKSASRIRRRATARLSCLSSALGNSSSSSAAGGGGSSCHYYLTDRHQLHQRCFPQRAGVLPAHRPFSSSPSIATNEDDLEGDDDGPLHEMYRSLVKKDDVQEDRHQLVALKALERLRRELLENPPKPFPTKDEPKQQGKQKRRASGWGSWFSSSSGGGSSKTTSTTESASTKNETNTPRIRGVYLHGGVGCGKTFLMNMFYDSLNTSETKGSSSWANNKQKTHFHKFMLNVHQGMHVARYSDSTEVGGTSSKPLESDSILPSVIDQVASKGRLVCLDEFQVTDVADALILQRLFTGLWDTYGCVLVATSNRPPDDLYWNGIQRDRFLPFIDLLKQKCEVISMDDSDTDYRLIQKLTSGSSSRVFFSGKKARKDFDELFYELANTSGVAPTSLKIQNKRKISIPLACLSKRMARFTFEDLCQKALGASDYLTLGHNFHTVFVEKIPTMSINEINWIRRFITFVDSMYESNVKLVLHTKHAATADQIFPRESENPGAHDEVFAFDRTLSRLEEMASQKYLRQKWNSGVTESELRDAAKVEV